VADVLAAALEGAAMDDVTSGTARDRIDELVHNGGSVAA
jgi:hypothetical protein